ncbi:MAG: membrane protein insertase YidC [Gammaproteobacteria bacterium]|nr:membrane protein insertase YidC [Gammaproteobacteria bacterium]
MDIQRIIILIGLAVTSYLLVLAWNQDYSGKIEPVESSSVNEISDLSDTLDDLPKAMTPEDIEDVVPQVDFQEVKVEVPKRLTKSHHLVVRTDVLDITIDLQGGDIVRAALPRYPAALDTPDVPFLLVDPRNSYAAQSGLIGPDGIDKSGNRPLFSSEFNRYELDGDELLKVNLTHRIKSGVDITKQFLFRKGDYLVDVSYLIENQSNSELEIAFFSQIKRDGQDPHAVNENSMGLKPFVGAATRTNDELYKKLSFDDIADEVYKAKIEGGYIAMVQHYFVSAWIPNTEGNVSYQIRKLANQDIYLLGFTTPLVTVPPNSSRQIGARYYVGPKDQYRLEQIAEGLNLTVDYGFLWWLAQPLFYLLTVIHGFFNNWGVAIILLTVIVKVLLFPLSAASFKSMAKMRKLQPEMALLKEKHGDDKQQFSQAMMELYKREGANPLGGCFPILLQMPVFLALYWTLMESVELRQAPFALWINDLSVMDPYFVLPILMGISMYLTQMLQPEPPDPVQAKVFKMMPIMFTFFFLWFPSGLVLYWLVNNILSIMQQWFVTRQIEKGSKKGG